MQWSTVSITGNQNVTLNHNAELQSLRSELAALEIALTGAQVERDHFRVALGTVTAKYEELLTRAVRPENAPALQHAPTNEED